MTSLAALGGVFAPPLPPWRLLLPARLAAADAAQSDEQADQDESCHLIHLLLFFGFRMTSLVEFRVRIFGYLPAGLAAADAAESHEQSDQNESRHRTPRKVGVRFHFPVSLSIPSVSGQTSQQPPCQLQRRRVQSTEPIHLQPLTHIAERRHEGHPVI